MIFDPVQKGWLDMRIKLKRHECHAPGKSHGHCGKRPYHASGGVARCGREAGGSGKRWIGRRVDLGKGGRVVGKRTGFSHFETALTHLFPGDST